MKYRKFKPKSWKKFLDPLKMKLEMNIDEAYLVHGRNNFLLLARGCGVIIGNNGIIADNGYKFKPKMFCTWDHLPELLRGYEISRNITPCKIIGEGDIGEFHFNTMSSIPRGCRVKSKSNGRPSSNSSSI